MIVLKKFKCVRHKPLWINSGVRVVFMEVSKVISPYTGHGLLRSAIGKKEPFLDQSETKPIPIALFSTITFQRFALGE